MGRICEVTGKKSRASASRSHSNIKTLRRQKANLHKKMVNGKVMILSARGIKTLKRRAALAK